LVNAVNRLTNEDVIFRSLNSIFDRNQDFYYKDVARATSAAPTFFPSAEIKNVYANIRYSLLDGGVGLNNPSKLVIDDESWWDTYDTDLNDLDEWDMYELICDVYGLDSGEDETWNQIEVYMTLNDVDTIKELYDLIVTN
jgi:patatin-like phospholipase/acyl hydrolase